MAMSGVGTRGELVGSRATGGFALAFKADALWVGAASGTRCTAAAASSTPRSATGCRWVCASSGRPGSAIRPHSTAGTSGWATCSGCWPGQPEPTVRARHRRAAAREPAGGRRQQRAARPGEHRVVTGSRKHVARASSTRRTQHGGSAEASGTAGRGQGPSRSRIRHEHRHVTRSVVGLRDDHRLEVRTNGGDSGERRTSIDPPTAASRDESGGRRVARSGWARSRHTWPPVVARQPRM